MARRPKLTKRVLWEFCAVFFWCALAGLLSGHGYYSISLIMMATFYVSLWYTWRHIKERENE